MLETLLSRRDLEALRTFDTCIVSNAIELFDVRLRNTGFTNPSIRCMFEDFPPLVGYAATARLRSEDPPIDRTPPNHTEWWKSIMAVPAPRIVVIEDMDKPPGRGALIGDVHAAMLRALGCIGIVTDGAVRELPRIRDMGFHLFAGNVSVSHSYAHIFHFGTTVTIGGLQVRPGDLLHGDLHGVLSIPAEIASEVVAAAQMLRESEDELIASCDMGRMSPDKLKQMLRMAG